MFSCFCKKIPVKEWITFFASFLNIPFRQKNTMQLRNEAARANVLLQGLNRITMNVLLSVIPSSIAEGKKQSTVQNKTSRHDFASRTPCKKDLLSRTFEDRTPPAKPILRLL
jgi:hypothetical protein